MISIELLDLICSHGTPQINFRCYTPADEYLIFGCFNLHITELALCADHATKWMYVQTQYKHKCHCGELIEDYIPIRIYNGQ